MPCQERLPVQQPLIWRAHTGTGCSLAAQLCSIILNVGLRHASPLTTHTLVAGFKKIDQTNSRRIPLANVLGPLLSVFGLAATYYAFQDPEAGRFQKLVDFSNWSGTHTVTCKYGAPRLHITPQPNTHLTVNPFTARNSCTLAELLMSCTLGDVHQTSGAASEDVSLPCSAFL